MANTNQSKSTPILLTTKLNTPYLKANLIPRRALHKRLIESLDNGTGLFLVSAPAGYGKTTLVNEWLNKSPIPYSWLSLDKKDNDPVQFLTYLITAFRKIVPNAGQVTQNLFTLPQLPSIDILITPLINELAKVDKRVIVILDDYHLIYNRYIHGVIQFVLDNRPHLLHLVLITREDPPLALTPLRAKGDLTEIRANDLRFSEDETSAFMASTMHFNLKKEAIYLLTNLTEGWIAGLQLAALSMQGRTPEEIIEYMNNFNGSNQYIIDYLVSEVLANLPKETSDFLQQTAVLDRFCASLCNTVTGIENSQAILELLIRNNLFLFPLDNQCQWYRYHHSFADSLRTKLSMEEQQIIYQKATRWYEANGYLEEAVACAIAAANYQEVGRLIYLTAPELLSDMRIATLMDWLEVLPDDLIHTNGELALLKMYILYFAGQIETIIPYIKIFENDLKAQTSALNRGRFCNICSILANSQEDPNDLHLAKEALDLVKDSYIDYVCSLNSYGSALLSAGNLTKAIEAFHEAYKLKETRRTSFVAMYSLYHLLLSLELNGRLYEALSLGEDIIAQMIDHHNNVLPLAKIAYLPLGIFYYKSNDLEQALKYLTSGIDMCSKLSLNRLLNGEYLLAQVYNALGDSKKALLTIRRAIWETNSSIQPVVFFNNTALEAEFQLRKGELEPAINWAKRWQLTPDDKPTLLREQSYFTYVRLLLAQGHIEDALHLLEFLEDSIKVGQRHSRLITVYILQALTFHLFGNEPKSLQYLSKALKLAAPEGYYRLFLDEGSQITAILPKVREIEPNFVTKLLKCFKQNPICISKPVHDNLDILSDTDLFEPLSKREIELLYLIAAGFSNEEISQKLVISLNTTKCHLKNIFRKLGVNSRIQAAIKGKELNLIQNPPSNCF